MLIFRRLLYKDVEQIDEAKEFNDETFSKKLDEFSL